MQTYASLVIVSAAGTVLAREGERFEALYHLAQGAAEVEIDGRVIGTTSDGFIGEMTFLADAPATATVTMRTPGRILVFEAARLRRVLRKRAEETLAVTAGFAGSAKALLMCRNREAMVPRVGAPGDRGSGGGNGGDRAMSDFNPGGPDRPHVTADDVHRLCRVWARTGAEMTSRFLDLATASSGRVAADLAQGVFGTWDPDGTARRVRNEAVQLATELAAVPTGAFGAAVAEFDAAPDPRSAKVERALSGADPAPTVTRVMLDPDLAERQRRMLAERAGFDPETTGRAIPPGETGVPFLLPARVLDSSQAWASWFVPGDTARGLLDAAVESGHQPPEVIDAFTPVTVGRDAAMVTLLASDYRASDFGVVQEIGLALSVSPRGARCPDPGQLFLRLIVTHPYSLGAARQIWGIRKDLHDNAHVPPRSRLDVAYAADRVRFGMGAVQPRTVPRDNTLQLGFPRLGITRSDRVPQLIYSMVDPHGLPARPVAPARSVLTRSGSQEGVQMRGDVSLTLAETREKGLEAGCLCAGGMACLCDTLRGLGLDRRRPVANGWTERMTGELAEPVRLAGQSEGKTSS